MRAWTAWRSAPATLLALAACGSPQADEPDRTITENATVYADRSPEGACLAAVAERAPGAVLQVTAPGAKMVGVTADGLTWTCRMRADGAVATLVPPEGRR